MIFTVFDTETSGLDVTIEDCLQFAYITLDQKYNVIRANQFYMWEDNYRWSEGAFNVHGISKEMLREDAANSDVMKKYQECYTVLSRGNLITYNGDTYDIPLMDFFLSRHAVKPELPNSSIDVMKIGQRAIGHRPKLVELCKSLNIDDDTINITRNMIFKDNVTKSAHDASFDTTATMLCLSELGRLGYV